MITGAAITNSSDKCQWCGLIHTQVCHLVKAIEYHQDGTIRRVEFKTATDYPTITMGGQHTFKTDYRGY